MKNNFFYIDQNQTKLYYIKNNTVSNSDSDIADYLGLLLKEYHNILLRFNARDIYNNSEMFFTKEENCQRAIDYLNENLDSFLVIKELDCNI